MTNDSGPAAWRIAVFGSGAMGGFYGVRLAEAGGEVHFLVRSAEERDILIREGWRIRSADGESRYVPVNVHAGTAEIGPCDLVVIALKTTANDALPGLVEPMLGPNTALLTLQNGLGNEEFLANLYGAQRVLGGLCFVCLNKLAPGVIAHLGFGNVALGEFGRLPGPRIDAIARVFRGGGIEVEVAADLAEARWRKLVWNIPFNGLTVVATARRAVGEPPISTAGVLADRELGRRAHLLMAEIVAVAGRLGYEIPREFVHQQFPRTLAMGEYLPSTLTDYLAGRPMEIEAIFGEPCRRARRAGVDCQRLEQLYGELLALTVPISS